MHSDLKENLNPYTTVAARLSALIFVTVLIVYVKCKHGSNLRGPVYCGLLTAHVLFFIQEIVDVVLVIYFNNMKENELHSYIRYREFVVNTFEQFIVMSIFYYTLFRMKSVLVYAEMIMLELELEDVI